MIISSPYDEVELAPVPLHAFVLDGAAGLTARQRQLLDLLADGHTNAQIARRLGIAEGTVRKHLENIYRRLGVSSRTAAVTRALFSDRSSSRDAR
jgi:DNA-binding CsgD family transcriptional regulator